MSPSTHSSISAPSDWVRRFAPLIPAAGHVLDLACGEGRHARFLAELGYRVSAVDRDEQALACLAGVPGIEVKAADVEHGPWPYPGQRFAGIVVVNYLCRSLFPVLLESLETSGILVYETFARGNERYGHPSNPQFLLQPGELLGVLSGRLRVIAYEDLFVTQPKQALVQRICAVNADEVPRSRQPPPAEGLG
jgi:SAM-dependent methyltransferase